MSGLEKKLRKGQTKHVYAIDITRYDKNARYLIGWPGYRTSRNKSGLGYFETQAEYAHMYGTFLKWLATGRFRTHNLIYLLIMTIVGLMSGVIPFVFIVHETVVHHDWDLLLLLVLFPPILIGLLLLVNVVLSIIYWDGKTITGD